MATRVNVLISKDINLCLLCSTVKCFCCSLVNYSTRNILYTYKSFHVRQYSIDGHKVPLVTEHRLVFLFLCAHRKDAAQLNIFILPVFCMYEYQTRFVFFPESICWPLLTEVDTDRPENNKVFFTPTQIKAKALELYTYFCFNLVFVCYYEP